jgi:hypothetical protein
MSTHGDEDEEEEYEANPRINRVPTVVEIKKALKELRNGKAAEVDNISLEVMKFDLYITADMLHPLFEKLWTEGEMRNDWRCGLLIKLPKKGDTANCDNWWGITLLSLPSKIFTRLLLNRIKEHVNVRLRNEQAGFRPNRSCIDEINTLQIIIEQCIEWSSRLYTVFVDSEKAFDSINREAMWKEVKRYGMPIQIVNVIKVTYQGCACRVVHEVLVSEPILVQTGVRQGCILSPTMFLIVIDAVMRNVNRDRRRGIQWGLVNKLEDLDFADDLCLLAETHGNMQMKLGDLLNETEKAGLVINVKTTKAMRINTNKTDPFTLRGESIEDVGSFTHRGSMVAKDGGAVPDVSQRIRKASGAFVQFYPAWKNNRISTRTKLRIFRSKVKWVLLYGSETRTVIKL